MECRLGNVFPVIIHPDALYIFILKRRKKKRYLSMSYNNTSWSLIHLTDDTRRLFVMWLTGTDIHTNDMEFGKKPSRNSDQTGPNSAWNMFKIELNRLSSSCPVGTEYTITLDCLGN